jgi:hypothetical protein
MKLLRNAEISYWERVWPEKMLGRGIVVSRMFGLWMAHS